MKQQNQQQQIEPLVKQAPTECLIDDTEIKTASKYMYICLNIYQEYMIPKDSLVSVRIEHWCLMNSCEA